MMTVRRASAEDARTIGDLAKQIWPVCYAHIITQDQIAFMLAEGYCDEALTAQMKAGQTFFILEDDGQPLGFASLSAESADVYKLNKLYVHQQLHGKGAGKMLIQTAEAYAKGNCAKHLILNVNRNNQAQHFYHKMGFTIVEEVNIDYHGYVLDDYVMAKNL
ncbi:GNAT family N-acetyltransferase [Pelobium manganitolerans]|uniref:GNAT family N-acetyltransferase n=1 Tax=Pelobium manganitolerans TaxID=1842495 RepID=UPI003FA39028